MKKSLIFIVVVVFLLPLALFSKELAETQQQEYVCRYMSRFFPRQHLTGLALDDKMAERVWNNYITSLDYEHIFFLQSDIKSFREQIHSIDDTMKDGDMSFAFKVYSVFRTRLTNRCTYVDQLLTHDFDFDKDEEYLWKRKDAPWAADEKEWNDLWRKRVKNELLRQKIAEMLEEEEPKDAASNGTHSATNVVAAVTTTTTNITTNIVTNTPAEAGAPAIKPPTIEERISKRYAQLHDIINDSDSDTVAQRFLTAFASSYDPHSSYLSPTSLDDFDIEMKLSLVGIGAVLQAEDGAAKVVRLIPGGPASRDKRDKRLQAGDKIIGVGQGEEIPVDVLHWPLSKMVQKIRGEKGTKVVLVVIPASDPSGNSLKTVDLIRDEVKLEEQAAKWSLKKAKDSENKERRLAVIDLPAFYADMKSRNGRSCADDVEQALREIATNDVDGIALDLRNNGGGSLLESVRMTGLFIHSGPAVQIREASNRGRILTDNDETVYYDGPLLVMVNRLSASASEIVAAALKDYGRAVIVGDSRTHGKGTVQTVLNIGKDPEYGAVKITTAEFYRITGDSTQLRGVIPDIHIPSPLDYMELGEDSLKYPIEWNRVRGCDYLPYDNLSDEIDTVRKLSRKRRETSEQFKVYEKMIGQMRNIYETEVVPLSLKERLKVARTEKEIMALQDKLNEDESGTEQKEEDETKDIVMQESLRILADLVSLLPPPSKDLPPPKEDEEPGGLMNKLKELFEENQ